MNKLFNRKKNNLKMGDSYHAWIVAGEPTKDNPWHVRCRCICGTNKLVAIQSLTSGKSRGCSRRCTLEASNTERGEEVQVSPDLVVGEVL